MVVTALDTKNGKIVGAYEESIEEDAAMRVEEGALWIDTARYDIAPGIRAFGIDVTSGYMPNCGEGGWGAIRTLYVRDGNKIRPILDALVMSRWSYVKGGNPRCMSLEYAAENPEAVIENIYTSIKVSKKTSNGYRDLIVTDTASVDDESKTKTKPFTYILKYDGKKYKSN